MHDIEYLLKYLLDSTTLKIERLQDITNLQQAAAFEKKFGDTKRIKAFCTEIGSTTYFPVFGVPLSQDSITHKVKLCSVAVGESIYVSKEYVKQMNPPGHYNSFITSDLGYQVGFLAESQTDVRNYWYAIKDPSKILPLFEITFEYDAELEMRSKGSFICDRCRISQSTSFCPAERASFCKECDEEVHNDHFLKRHVRYYFNEVGKKKFIYCTSHMDTMVDYFCEECFIPVCTKCKISGNHSELPNGSHNLLNYVEACDKLQDLLKAGELRLVEEEKRLKENIGDFKKNVEVFQNNISDVRGKIESEYRNSMNELHAFEKREFQVINTHYISYLIRLAEIERMREYPSGLEPSQLLRTFKSVTIQRESLSEDTEEDVFKPAELSLKGHLTLKDEENYTTRKGYSPRMEKSTQLYVETRGINVNSHGKVNNP
ncbi:zinc finger domain-containing protein [Encephalitozoon romaleae SJ-2008]|uniref:Zinc finger domain-containing protein n=1 Tax=Encephalitozoon romaleae (strain SJ-2008) TaxID=1178016 RepID=I6ZUN9_ENCRO|nr:zinc finger domain-containing protein [Encephalitozoon romaleae SJ-2008]AFN83426.1 zinc finger domain-containing protein [Encephalitozoon romaleae SJ-2008]